jgi:hypothetical protein
MRFGQGFAVSLTVMKRFIGGSVEQKLEPARSI